MPWMSINQWKKKHKIGMKPKLFKLLGFDRVSSEWYDLGGFETEVKAKAAAQGRLEVLEKLQPSANSAGQSNTQDQVHIEHPDGMRCRVFPGM